ncbi:hypothetical protein [Occultella kanbiaonis]|uniref:hypothetical protein n=1 Tax=Occultella kanbiaonis TaxID=2675754 RepID=UPI0013CF52E2|nr:hypothetical protein [Occultella kanbiaonis]
MTSETIAAIIIAVLGGGSLTALVLWKQDRRRAPIERAQATDASEKIRSEIRTADIDGLRDIIEALREEITGLRNRVEKAEKRAADAESGRIQDAQRAARRATADAAYIELLLETWPSPPPPQRPVQEGGI